MSVEDCRTSKQEVKRIIALIDNKPLKEHNFGSGEHSALLKGSFGDQLREATPNNEWTVRRFLGAVCTKRAMNKHQGFPKACGALGDVPHCSNKKR